MTRSEFCKKIQDVWAFPPLQPSHSPESPKASLASVPGHSLIVVFFSLGSSKWADS